MKITQYHVDSFMSNINKCDEFVHRKSHSEIFGTVELKTPAYLTKNGKRVFSLSKSPIGLHSGSYTYAGLRKAFESKIG